MDAKFGRGPGAVAVVALQGRAHQFPAQARERRVTGEVLDAASTRRGPHDGRGEVLRADPPLLAQDERPLDRVLDYDGASDADVREMLDVLRRKRKGRKD